jgi:hypothetical protein
MVLGMTPEFGPRHALAKILSEIAPFGLNGVKRHCWRSGRFQDAEGNDLACQETMAADIGGKISATA